MRPSRQFARLEPGGNRALLIGRFCCRIVAWHTLMLLLLVLGGFLLGLPEAFWPPTNSPLCVAQAVVIQYGLGGSSLLALLSAAVLWWTTRPNAVILGSERARRERSMTLVSRLLWTGYLLPMPVALFSIGQPATPFGGSCLAGHSAMEAAFRYVFLRAILGMGSIVFIILGSINSCNRRRELTRSILQASGVAVAEGQNASAPDAPQPHKAPAALAEGGQRSTSRRVQAVVEIHGAHFQDHTRLAAGVSTSAKPALQGIDSKADAATTPSARGSHPSFTNGFVENGSPKLQAAGHARTVLESTPAGSLPRGLSGAGNWPVGSVRGRSMTKSSSHASSAHLDAAIPIERAPWASPPKAASPQLGRRFQLSKTGSPPQVGGAEGGHRLPLRAGLRPGQASPPKDMPRHHKRSESDSAVQLARDLTGRHAEGFGRSLHRNGRSHDEDVAEEGSEESSSAASVVAGKPFLSEALDQVLERGPISTPLILAWLSDCPTAGTANVDANPGDVGQLFEEQAVQELAVILSKGPAFDDAGTNEAVARSLCLSGAVIPADRDRTALADAASARHSLALSKSSSSERGDVETVLMSDRQPGRQDLSRASKPRSGSDADTRRHPDRSVRSRARTVTAVSVVRDVTDHDDVALVGVVRGTRVPRGLQSRGHSDSLMSGVRTPGCCRIWGNAGLFMDGPQLEGGPPAQRCRAMVGGCISGALSAVARVVGSLLRIACCLTCGCEPEFRRSPVVQIALFVGVVAIIGPGGAIASLAIQQPGSTVADFPGFDPADFNKPWELRQVPPEQQLVFLLQVLGLAILPVLLAFDSGMRPTIAEVLEDLVGCSCQGILGVVCLRCCTSGRDSVQYSRASAYRRHVRRSRAAASRRALVTPQHPRLEDDRFHGIPVSASSREPSQWYDQVLQGTVTAAPMTVE
jgi:hypothetical protein